MELPWPMLQLPTMDLLPTQLPIMDLLPTQLPTMDLLPTQLPTMDLLPTQLPTMLSTMPPLMLSPRARTNPTPTSTELLMTTQRLTSTLLRLLMEPVLSLDLTLLLFPMVVPSMSSTLLTTITDMLSRSHTKESQSTPRPSLMPLLPPLPTMLKPSLCFVNIYQNIY